MILTKSLPLWNETALTPCPPPPTFPKIKEVVNPDLVLTVVSSNQESCISDKGCFLAMSIYRGLAVKISGEFETL
jgi:hypothetical protein